MVSIEKNSYQVNHLCRKLSGWSKLGYYKGTSGVQIKYIEKIQYVFHVPSMHVEVPFKASVLARLPERELDDFIINGHDIKHIEVRMINNHSSNLLKQL